MAVLQGSSWERWAAQLWPCSRLLTTPSIGALTLYDGTQADAALGNPIHLEALLLVRLRSSWEVHAELRSVGRPRSCSLSVGLEFTFER